MNSLSPRDTIKTITTHYIDGGFVESHGREVMDLIRPTDRKVIGRVTLGDEEDTRRAIFAAKRAFVTFGRTTKEERANYLQQLHAAVSARIDDLTAAMVEEYGGVVQFARPIVQSGAGAFLASEKALQELPWTKSWGKTTVTLEPVGVAGLITAWNANALFICLKLASAIGAGCTVVIKPSEISSLQTQVMLECLNAAKLPKGVCNVVTGRGDVVVRRTPRNSDVAKISFTGSVAVGQGIMRDGAETMKRVTLELGGKSPTILLDDANLSQAIPSALVLALMNSGQACAAGSRTRRSQQTTGCGQARHCRGHAAHSPLATPLIQRPPSDRWPRRSSTSGCNPTSAWGSKNEPKCWLAVRVTRMVSRRATTSSPRCSST